MKRNPLDRHPLECMHFLYFARAATHRKVHAFQAKLLEDGLHEAVKKRAAPHWRHDLVGSLSPRKIPVGLGVIGGGCCGCRRRRRGRLSGRAAGTESAGGMRCRWRW